MRLRPIALAAAGAAFVLAPCTAAIATDDAAPATPDDAVAAATHWLAGQQQRDGGFDAGLPGAETPDAVLALAEAAQTASTWSTRAAVERVESVTTHGHNALDAVHGFVADADVPATVARIVTRVALPLGLDPGEEGPLGDLTGRVDRALAHPGDLAFLDKVELGLAVLATGGTLPDGFLDEILAAQQANGGWGPDGDPEGEVVDLRTTGAATDFVVKAGVDPGGEAVQGALRLAADTEEASGGWIAEDGAPDVAATAGAIRIIRATGEDPAATCWRTDLGLNPTEGTATSYLVAQQDEDGHFGGEHPVLVTSDAVHSLSGRWLPLGRGAARGCGTRTGGLPFEPSLLVLGAIVVFGVGGGIRIMRGSGQPV